MAFLNLSAFLFCLNLSSCSYNITKKKSKTEIEDTSTSILKDSLVVEHKLTERSTIRYGDTLKGLVYINDGDTLCKDTLESNGVKITSEVRRTTTGYRQKLQAVAKPVETIHEKALDQKGAKETSTQKHDKYTEKETNKDKHAGIKPNWFGIMLFLLLILLLVYLYRKYLL